MRHLKKVTVAKASDDIGAAIFFQLYFTVLSIMLSAALGGK